MFRFLENLYSNNESIRTISSSVAYTYSRPLSRRVCVYVCAENIY